MFHRISRKGGIFHRNRMKKRNSTMYILGGLLLAALLGGGIYMVVRRNMHQTSLYAPRHERMAGKSQPEGSAADLQREVNIMDDAQNRTFPL